MNTPLLAFHQVEFSYLSEGKPVLNSLSLEISPGTVTAILGPNGAGKTTLLHLALGWLKPRRGQVLLRGKPLGSYARRELGQWMALVPQSEHIPFDYSLLEYTLFGRTPYLNPLDLPGDEDCRLALQALEQVGMAGLAQRSILTLSGGERQLVIIGRALAQQPHLLLLDEPTAHLDLSNKSRLLKVLEGLVEQGVTILLTTHEPEVAAALATHLVLMREGQVKVSGPLQEVLTSEHLSAIYGVPVKVVQVDGRKVVVWDGK